LVAVSLAQKKDESVAVSRSWFTTFTLITGTSTSTTTFTSTTTCTTSTTALSICTAGRRRRGLFYDEGESKGKVRRGLFYNDNDAENDDGSIFLASPENREAKAEKPAPLEKAPESPLVIGLEVQSGFTLPDGVKDNRWGLAFGQTTTTTTTTTTSTSTLTATCSSTTAFPTCGTGK
jgi:hypothetical protein